MIEPEGEDSYRARYDKAPCGLMSTASNGLILRANRTLCTWLGYAAEELQGKRRLQDLLTMGGKIFHQTHWWPLLQMQGSVAEVQLDFVHRDGHNLPILINAVQRVDESVTTHDIAMMLAADRRKYEAELLLARRRAEELLVSERAAQAALKAAHLSLQSQLEQRVVLAEQLVGIVSHDLRNPMNTISVGVSLLASKDATPPQLRIANRISSAAARATRLIGDLLDFTQARIGGGLPAHPELVDLHSLVHECVEELKLAWPGRMIDHRPSGVGPAKADPDRIAQVISNLVGNAITYGDPLQAVTVRSVVSDDGLALSVHNAGSAIPEALLPHIFEPLRRGEQQVKLGSRSVGLGLYIVREVALAHGGDVTVHSSVETGTTFTVNIPLARSGVT